MIFKNGGNMKAKIFSVLVVLLLLSIPSFAQQVSQSDSIATAMRIKQLKLKENSLKNEIEREDSKRNAQIIGVTPETQEILNNQQDSICLELRSQLVTVELELKELEPNNVVQTVLNQYNSLNQLRTESTKPEENMK